MGNFNTAVFIRNEKQMTKEEFTEEICKCMESRGYKRASAKSGSPYKFTFSEHLQTSCIGIELVDSDFAEL